MSIEYQRGHSWDKILFQDINHEWCVVSYMNNLDNPLYAIRHSCTTVQQIGAFTNAAYVYRHHIANMAEKCQYCHTVAPEAIQAVFMFLVME